LCLLLHHVASFGHLHHHCRLCEVTDVQSPLALS
jgi:hypothetical protein